MMKGLWVEIRTERDHSPVTFMDKTNLTWGEKKDLIYHQSYQSRIIRNKTNLKSPSPHPSLLPQLNFSPDFLPPPPAWRRGMGVAISSSHVVSAAPSSSGGGLLILCPCSSMGSLLWDTALHGLLQHGSFPCSAVLHKLPQHGSFPGAQSFRNKLLQHGSPVGSQVLTANLLQHGLLSPRVHKSYQEPAPVVPTGSQPPSGIQLL